MDYTCTPIEWLSEASKALLALTWCDLNDLGVDPETTAAAMHGNTDPILWAYNEALRQESKYGIDLREDQRIKVRDSLRGRGFTEDAHGYFNEPEGN